MVTLWSSSSSPKYQGTTYSNSLTWRSVLSGVHSSAVTPNGYYIQSANRALSYVAELSSLTTSGGQLDIDIYGSLGQLTTISFTVMIVTASNPYFELLPTGTKVVIC